jgi:hypothetical protein
MQRLNKAIFVDLSLVLLHSHFISTSADRRSPAENSIISSTMIRCQPDERQGAPSIVHGASFEDAVIHAVEPLGRFAASVNRLPQMSSHHRP